MDKKRKLIVIIAGGAIVLIGSVFLARLISNNTYRSQIPDIPDSYSMSVAVKEQLSQAFKKAKRVPSADNLGMLGMAYHSSASYEQATECYHLAIQRDESAWIWNYYLGYLNMEMGNANAIIENFKSVIDKNPDMDLAWYYLGEEYRNLRDNELAEMSFGKITSPKNESSAPKNPTRYDYFPLSTYAMFQLSRIYFDKGEMDLAESTLKKIIQDNRSFGPAYRLLGNLYSISGDMALSKKYTTRANDLVAFAPPVDTLVDRLVLLSRSELYLLKKIDEAENSIYPEWAMKLVNHAMEYLPDNKYLISKAIKICLMLDLDQQAAGYTDRHISYYRDNFTEMYNMGMLFFQKRLYPQSLQYFTRALDLKPDDAEIQNCMAICYWTVGERQKTNEILDTLLNEYYDNPDILADVTSLLFDLGEEEKATVQLTRLKRIAPAQPKVLKMSGGLAEKNGNIDEAISLYEQSIEGNHEEITTIRHLGDLLIRQKMWDKAIRHYKESLAYHANDPYLLERLGTLLVTCPDPDLRDLKEGKEYSERAFIHTTSRSITLISAGRSLAIADAALGDLPGARQVIGMTINLARRENLSSAYLSELETIAGQFKASN
jgi:tetratricopeptide (TPR) repeat protein